MLVWDPDAQVFNDIALKNNKSDNNIRLKLKSLHFRLFNIDLGQIYPGTITLLIMVLVLIAVKFQQSIVEIFL